MARTYYEKPKRIEKLSPNEKIDFMFDLINSFSIVRSPTETAFFLQDLLTANEIRNLSVRLRIAKLLLSGKTQREISQEVHSSLATVNKISIWLEEGGEGFKKVIAKLPIKYNLPKKLPRGPIEFHLPQLLLATGQYLVAKSQQTVLEKFKKGIEKKRVLDKSLIQASSDYYRIKKKGGE